MKGKCDIGLCIPINNVIRSYRTCYTLLIRAWLVSRGSGVGERRRGEGGESGKEVQRGALNRREERIKEGKRWKEESALKSRLSPKTSTFYIDIKRTSCITWWSVVSPGGEKPTSLSPGCRHRRQGSSSGHDLTHLVIYSPLNWRVWSLMR